MNGEWIWILLALFGIFRLLMLAGKKKAGAPPPVSRGPVRDEPPPPPEEVDELKKFIDSLTGIAEAGRRGRPPSPPGEWGPASRPPDRHRPRPPAPRPEPKAPAPHRAPAAGTFVPDRPVPGLLSAPLHPVVRGIIFSEILGPPRGLGGGSRLPSDPEDS